MGYDYQWLDHLMPPIVEAEEKYVKRKKKHRETRLRAILSERPEIVGEFYKLLFTSRMQLPPMQEQVNEEVGRLSDDLFYP